MEIENDSMLIEFLESKKRRNSTKVQYIKRMKRYCDFTGLNPTELIKEAEFEEETIFRMKLRIIKGYLEGFRDYMESSKNTKTAINDTMITVKAFYRYHEIVLPNISNTNVAGHNRTVNELPNLKHLERLIERAGLKYKALIMLGMSSGMGGGELRSLKVKDYFSAHGVNSLDQIDESKIPTWHIKRIKTNTPYYTYSSPESNRTINHYLQGRNSITDDEWLFDINGHQMSDKTLSNYCARLNDAMNFGFVGKQRFFHAHVLRKVFASTALKHGMNPTDVNWLIGHGIHRMTEIYARPSIHRLKKEYMKILPYVSITPVKTVVYESDEVKELKRELEIQKERLNLYEKMIKLENEKI
ncbi:MAG: tyrosine-type recombinase/integrase [Methanobacterium sp.]